MWRKLPTLLATHFGPILERQTPYRGSRLNKTLKMRKCSSIVSARYLQTPTYKITTTPQACALWSTPDNAFRKCCGSFEIRPECLIRISCKDCTASWDSLLHKIQIQAHKHTHQMDYPKVCGGVFLTCRDSLPWGNLVDQGVFLEARQNFRHFARFLCSRAIVNKKKETQWNDTHI